MGLPKCASEADPPPNLRKELMVPVLAYRMQERELGGLSHAARRRLREVAPSLNTEKPSQERSDSAPQTGTRLLRMWRGEMHEVIATGMAIYIRDKIAASKRKGMWIGGVVPLAMTSKIVT